MGNPISTYLGISHIELNGTYFLEFIITFIPCHFCKEFQVAYMVLSLPHFYLHNPVRLVKLRGDWPKGSLMTE